MSVTSNRAWRRRAGCVPSPLVLATQKIFGIGRPAEDVGWRDMLPLMQAEAAHVWEQYERGVLREAWVRTDALGAVYCLEQTADEAAVLLSEQPLARAGLVEFELVPVGPFTPLSLLFGSQSRPIAPVTPTVSADSQRVLALDHPRPEMTTEELARRMPEEARHAWALWKGGVIRESYLRTDRPGAALMLEVAGTAGAHAVLSDFPLVRSGLIEFECLALATFMGFDALLEGSLDGPLQLLADPTEPVSD